MKFIIKIMFFFVQNLSFFWLNSFFISFLLFGLFVCWGIYFHKQINKDVVFKKHKRILNEKCFFLKCSLFDEYRECLNVCVYRQLWTAKKKSSTFCIIATLTLLELFYFAWYIYLIQQTRKKQHLWSLENSCN